MTRFTSSKETGTIRCTICGGLVSGELQYSGDNYCKGHETEQLNIFDVVWRSEQLKAYADFLERTPNFQKYSNKDLAIDYNDSL